MEGLVQLIVNNGIGVVCVAYMIYFQLVTMRDMNKTLVTITTTLQSINDRLNSIEDNIDKRS